MTNVAEQFTEEQIQEMKEAFNMFDRNRFLAAKTQLSIEMRTDYVMPLIVTAQYTTYNLSSFSRSLESTSLRPSSRFVFMNVCTCILS